MITLGSLFDWIGGFPLAAVHNGIIPIWASEIETFPIEVTKIRFPDMLHVGDITKLKGEDLPPVDISTGGSPCQDFSSLKKGGLGLHGEKSKLFYSYLECLERFKPKYFLLENVNMDKYSKDKISELIKNKKLSLTELRNLQDELRSKINAAKASGKNLNDYFKGGC